MLVSVLPLHDVFPSIAESLLATVVCTSAGKQARICAADNGLPFGLAPSSTLIGSRACFLPAGRASRLIVSRCIEAEIGENF